MLPKKVSDRFIKEVARYQTVLREAKNRDVNEADTATIVADILANVMGFDKYSEVTREFAIRGTYCDLAVKSDGALKYLIEVKAIGLDLKGNHLIQAINYGANQGIHWVVLTNGVLWEIHRIKFEKPIQSEKVCTLDFFALNARKNDDQERLFLLSKEGLKKSAIDEYHERAQTVNRYTIGALLTSPAITEAIRREIKKLCNDIKVDPTEIEAILKNEVLKRDVIEGEPAMSAAAKIKKAHAKAAKKTVTAVPATPTPQMPVAQEVPA